MSQQVNAISGIGPLGILWVAFILLKVMHVIDWTWLVVICWPIPVWLLGVAVCLLIISLYSYNNKLVN